MTVVGWIVGLLVGLLLGAGLAPSLGLVPVIGGILSTIVAPIAPILAPLIGLVSIPIALLIGGMGFLVATAVAYGLAAVSLLGAGTVGGAITTNPIELFCRGFMIGLTTAANALLIPFVTGLPGLAIVVLVFGLLTSIPPIAANRTVFQPLLGLLSWVLPLTWMMLPLGIILFVLNLPFALAQSGFAALRFDVRTSTIETSGGALLNFIFGLSPSGPAAGFNLGNFTFLTLAPGAAPSTVQGSFIAPSVSSHETGHTLAVAAFGGFFGWINAVDENIAPLARGSAAYGEIIPESHSSGRGPSFLPMW